jgi:hypothetical protein
MGEMSSEDLGRGFTSAICSSLSVTGAWEAAAVDGLSVRGIGVNDTEIPRLAKTERRAVTRFSMICQHVVWESFFLRAPASWVYATSCLKATDFAGMFDDT